MQLPNSTAMLDHLRKIAKSRQYVFMNFRINDFYKDYFTEFDIAYVRNLFDSFCEETPVEQPTLKLDHLREIMANQYKWNPLPDRLVIKELLTHLEHTRAPEPIVHAGFTEAMRIHALEVNATLQYHVTLTLRFSLHQQSNANCRQLIGKKIEQLKSRRLVDPNPS